MHPFFIYLIQVNISLALFYLLYAVVLKRDTFFGLRRLFFLSAILFSLLFPFFSIPSLADLWISRSSGLQEATAVLIAGKPEMVMVAEDGNAAVFAVSRGNILAIVYIIVSLLFLLRFAGQLLSILRIKRRSEKRLISGIPVYQLKGDITPFSFFNLIFVHTEKHSEEELSQILLHEQTHVRQHHSADVMLIELFCLLSWWNPFVWLMKREMAMNLEYLADNGVLRRGIDSRDYQYHLLRLTYHETAVQIVNNFNVSQLKQRIMMMNKTKSPALTPAKYLLIFPMVFLLMVAGSCVNRDKKTAGETITESSAPATETKDVSGTSSGETGNDNGNLLKIEAKEAKSSDAPPSPAMEPSSSDEIFDMVEVNPEFPGGVPALNKWLSDNISYPTIAQENGIQGRVIVNFVVEKDGSLSNVTVVRGVDPSLDKESVRVVESMPKWKPGAQKGKTVRTRFTLPLVFRLQN